MESKFQMHIENKDSGAFDKIKEFINNDGIVFGGSAGAIIFGKDLDACKLDDTNDVNLKDTEGFDVLNGISLLCHYTNRTIEKDKQSTEYLLSISNNRELLALPEEDTIFINENDIYDLFNPFEKSFIYKTLRELTSCNFFIMYSKAVEKVTKI